MRSKAPSTRSTSEDEVEGVCINQLVYTRVLPLQRFRVEDTSMRPVVQPGDRLLVGRWLRPRRGSLVVVRDPEYPSTFLLKRVARVEPNGDLLGCTFLVGGASGTSGNVLSFTLTNTGGGSETISFDAATTFYLTSSFTTDPAGTLNTLAVVAGVRSTSFSPTSVTLAAGQSSTIEPHR